MAKFYTLAYFFIASMGWSAALEEDHKAIVEKTRQPRHLLQSKLCFKFGICGGQGGYNNHQGAHGGYQGGYNQGGYNQGGYPYPPINIGISQSQSSSSAGGGGYGSTNYPNNYQYNGGYPNYGGYPNNEGYPNNGGFQNYGGYNGHNRPGYFGNGLGSYNNQFNGNYNGGVGGYGFQQPYGCHGDSSNDEEDEDEYSRSAKSKN